MSNFKRSYLGLALTQAISQLGSLLTNFAVSWIIIDGSRSAGWLAAYLGYSAMLYAVFSLFAGRMLDTFNRKNVLVFADMCGAVCLILLAAAEALGISGLKLYFVVTFFTQLSGTLIMVGTQSVMGDFGHGEDTAKAQASFETFRRIFSAGGPVLAGLLVAVLPRWSVFATDSVTYLISLGGALVFVPRSALPVITERKRSFAAAVLPKMSWGRKVNIMAMLVIGINLLYAPVLLLWPLLAKKMAGGPALMGFLSGSFLVGSIAGGLWVIGGKGRDVWTQGLNSILLVSAGFAAMSFLGGFPGIFLALPAFVLGIGFGSVNAPIMGIIHSIVPKEEKGGFFGWLGFVGQVGQPAAMLLAGAVAAKLGPFGMVIGAAASGGVVAMAFRNARKKFEAA